MDSESLNHKAARKEKTAMGKHCNSQKRISRFFNIIFSVIKYTALVFLTLGLAGTAFVVSYLMGLDEWKEFDPHQIDEMQQTLLIFDKDGVETAALYNKENRVYIPIGEIPKHVKNAFIAIEDARFYEHGGVDIIRILGSLIEDLKSGSLKQGASTISQQLVKNTSLTGVKTISRKLQEAVMAFKLEQVYSKDQILEMYLNYIYFGNGAYGIEAAAKTYFGVSAKSLSLAQAALLAGVIKGPSHYAPHINLQKSIERRNLVLSAMREQGMISEREEKEAKEEAVVLAEKSEAQYGYFTDMVLAEAENILNLDGEELLSSGCRIYTTLDQELQKQVEAIYDERTNFPDNAADGELCQSALCILDSKTSEIRAIIGGRKYETRRGINRATDIKRQPGSAIKPVIVYAPALEKLGYTPATMVLDEKGNFNGYVPKNFSENYKGWVTLREAVAQSLNLPAVRVFETLGVETGKLYASQVGIPFDEKDQGLTLALGGFTTGVSPLCLANSFTPFANGGYYSMTSCISKIENGRGEVIYERPDTRISVLSPDTAYLMTSMMQSAVESGTAKRVGVEGVPIAAKTGTAGAGEDNRDAWTVAYNPDYTMCCWMGFDSTDTSHCLPSQVTGGTYPAELLSQVFSAIYRNKKAPDFVRPKDIVAVRIDIRSLKDGGPPMLAGAFTPDEQTILEYFPQKSAPSEYTTYWSVPSPPDDLSVTLDENGLPVVSFTPKDSYVVYRIMRKDLADRTVEMAGEYSGASLKVNVTDYSAEYGRSYEYYVVPVHPDIKIGGEQLCGPPSQGVRIRTLKEEDYLP